MNATYLINTQIEFTLTEFAPLNSSETLYFEFAFTFNGFIFIVLFSFGKRKINFKQLLTSWADVGVILLGCETSSYQSSYGMFISDGTLLTCACTSIWIPIMGVFHILEVLHYGQSACLSIDLVTYSFWHLLYELQNTCCMFIVLFHQGYQHG